MRKSREMSGPVHLAWIGRAKRHLLVTTAEYKVVKISAEPYHERQRTKSTHGLKRGWRVLAGGKAFSLATGLHRWQIERLVGPLVFDVSLLWSSRYVKHGVW